MRKGEENAIRVFNGESIDAVNSYSDLDSFIQDKLLLEQKRLGLVL